LDIRVEGGVHGVYARVDMPFAIGDLVTYHQHSDDPDPPRGRIIQLEREVDGEMLWLVGWEQADGSVMRLKSPESSLRRL
jgi:hypothetical protein